MSSIEGIIADIREVLPQCLVSDRVRIEERMTSLGPPKNPDVVEKHLLRLREQARASHESWIRKKEGVPPIEYPEQLPISARREEIVSLIREHPVLVIAGETGSGKTTQLPKMCLEAGYGVGGKIACTQPRRVAALSVSQRIAEELKVPWGKEVGCKIRFSDKTSDETRIKMMTDGLLLAEVQSDPLLREYEVIIIDEAHERSLNIDFLLGYLQLLRKDRPDLKVLITSATIDTETFSNAFGNAPIVEVSGRTYPVNVRHRPLDDGLEEAGEFTYIEGAVKAVEDLVSEFSHGDILVFMPGERDIREARDSLSKSRLGDAEILPLFGRLSSGDQQRIFSSMPRRKIILATNIAETSITIPGIRFVVDTGLARVSRYSTHTRTQRLPVEKISRSSAEQRKGRCGRVSEGLCIRLFSEEDFESRPQYSQPEILRSNLAAVILKMLAFNIGDVETFPFVDPPHKRSIQGGMQLLEDLGALDDRRQLTPLGRELAHLPVDPTVGRMLLQARREKALKEVLVIAAGLSIQDPRDRPFEKKEAADEMHRRFVHPKSDFLTLLNIWNAYHEDWEKMNQRQLRKFCQSHFLSYIRMREWRDVYQQLSGVMKQLGGGALNDKDAEYAAIHRSILSGLLGGVAQREEGNHYRAPHNRKVMLFPGSGLFDRKAERSAGKKKKAAQGGGSTPSWIVAGEWMETTRLYARTVARINPTWILSLGNHLCKSSLGDPYWDPKRGCVLVRERISLYGLEVDVRSVDFDRVDPERATEIFVRSGLVEGGLEAASFSFLEHNEKLREKVADWQTRIRRNSTWGLEEKMVRFYEDRLKGIYSRAALATLLKKKKTMEPDFLFMTESDFLDTSEGLVRDREAFPDSVSLGGKELRLNYAYKPGEDEDGVTLKVSLNEFGALQAGMLDWLVPGFVEEKVNCLLRGLPKEIRKQLFPIAETARKLTDTLEPSPRPLSELLGAMIRERYGIRIRDEDWSEEAVPDHLKPRIEVTDKENRTLAAGRDWEMVLEACRKKVSKVREVGRMPGNDLWEKAALRWEKHGLTTWSFGDVPERILIGDVSGVPVEAYPGLQLEEAGVGVVLFQKPEEAEAASREGILYLYEQELGRDLAWLKKDLRGLKKIGPLLATVGPVESFEEQAYRNICNELFLVEAVLPLSEAKFQNRVESARERLRGFVPRFIDLLTEILEKRQEILLCDAPYTGMKEDLNSLIGKDFLIETPYASLQHLSRYLRAMMMRAERAKANPQKDEQKAAQLRPFSDALAALQKDAKAKARAGDEIDELRWMIEEFRVSLFAQELGTAIKVSEKKLTEKITRIREMHT